MVLFPNEAEGMVEALEHVSLQEIGKLHWTKMHDYVEKLNMQAVLSATNQSDEFIKEFLISHGKLNLLVTNLITIELWKERIFPELNNIHGFVPEISFPIYVVLYHEATLINLLETILYHADAQEQIGDVAIDLADYCYRRLTHLVFELKSNQSRFDVMRLKTASDIDDKQANSGDFKSTSATTMSTSGMAELTNQNRVIQFDVSIKAAVILCYMSDHLSCLPLSVATRIYNTYDIPVLLVNLVENPPWTITNPETGVLYKYIDNRWRQMSDSNEICQITRLEGQVWIALYQLLLSPDFGQKYEINSYRKNELLRLRSHLTDVTLDQMPNLGELRKYLEYMVMAETPAIKPDLILEQVPQLRDAILREYTGQWSKLANAYADWLSSTEAKDCLQKQAQGWTELYNDEALEALISEPPKCALCGSAAAKRCSRCRNEWYCRRECQLDHWKKHKKVCDLMSNAEQKSSS